MYQEEYANKLMPVKEAAKLIQSNDVIVSSMLSGMPLQLIREIGARYQELENVKIESLFAFEPFNFLTDPEAAKRIRFTTHFMGPVERKLYPMGNFDVNSVNFSDLPKHMVFEDEPNWFVLQSAPMDENGFFNLGPMGTPFSRMALNRGDLKVILSVNNKMTKVNNQLKPEKGCYFAAHIDEIDYIVEHDEPLPGIPSSSPTDVEKRIANHIIPNIPDGATLQVGFGGLSNAVSLGMIGHVEGLKVHTEMITESMIELRKKGVITGKIYGAFALGTQALYEFCEEDDNVELGDISIINNPHNIAAIDKFVSINACLMVDLTGQVASECIGPRQVSSVGGAMDFVRGSVHSKGGKSFICVTSTSTDKDGKVSSNIRFALPPATPVTCPRQDVMNIVTEYGIANIRNQPISERVKRLIAVAHPDFRDELTQQAKEAGYIH